MAFAEAAATHHLGVEAVAVGHGAATAMTRGGAGATAIVVIPLMATLSSTINMWVIGWFDS